MLAAECVKPFRDLRLEGRRQVSRLFCPRSQWRPGACPVSRQRLQQQMMRQRLSGRRSVGSEQAQPSLQSGIRTPSGEPSPGINCTSVLSSHTQVRLDTSLVAAAGWQKHAKTDLGVLRALLICNSFWKHSSIPVHRKVNTYKTLVESKLMYGLSCLCLSAADRRFTPYHWHSTLFYFPCSNHGCFTSGRLQCRVRHARSQVKSSQTCMPGGCPLRAQEISYTACYCTKPKVTYVPC